MKELVGKGLTGQIGVGGIFVLLILQIVLPYVSGGPKASGEDTTNTEVLTAVNKYQGKVATLTQLNLQQCENDKTSKASNEKQVEALSELSKAIALLASSTTVLQKAVDKLESRSP
jgi:hypothetical protein